MAANRTVFFIRQINENGEVRVYGGVVSDDGSQVIVRGSHPEPYTEEFRAGVRNGFQIGEEIWSQSRLATEYLTQNQAVADSVKRFVAELPRAPAELPPAVPMGNEFQEEEDLELAEILVSLQTFRDRRARSEEDEEGAYDEREVGEKDKRGGKRTKRKRSKRKTKRK